MAKILVLGSVFVDVMLAVEKLPLRGEDVQAKQRKRRPKRSRWIPAVKCTLSWACAV